MRLTSTAFSHGSEIPRKYTCQGEDVNPPLQWSDVPPGTGSFALIVDDPDAPMGTWIHWLVKDIPVSATSIAEDSIPGVEIPNSFGKLGYGGPCPPSGRHRYFFKLYALDVPALPAVNARDFYNLVEKHKIAQAVLMGTYQKA